jgi:hypothetical protein
MFDDIFLIINDWFDETQEFNLDDFLVDQLPNSDDLINDFNNYPELDNTDNFVLDNDNFQHFIETEITHNFFSQSDYLSYENDWNSEQFNGVGNPFEDANFWQEQAGSSSCAVVAQMGVYESITGVELPEDAVCQIAEVNGWFDPNSGTSPEALGKILNAFGVTTETQYDASLNDIASALERGDKVIVALDANEIWNPLRDEAGNPIEQEDGGHAVWVTGIDQDEQGNIKVILNDSGISDGQMKVIDGVDFINAWDDFGNHLVIAENTTNSVIV